MIRLRAWWVLGLVLSVSGCAGTNRRPAWQPAPPLIGRAEAAEVPGGRGPALAREGPAIGEVGPETRREPRILSRYFPGLSRRGSRPAEPQLADGSNRPLAAPSAAGRGRAAAPAAAGSTAPLLSVAIDIAAPPADDQPDARSPLRAAAEERLTSLETSPAADPAGPPPLVEADEGEVDWSPPTAQANRSDDVLPIVATDPDADPVLAGRPRMRRSPPLPPSGLPADLPAASFPRSYYAASPPPVATRVDTPEPEVRPRRPRWPRLFLHGGDDDAPAESARGEAGDVAQRG